MSNRIQWESPIRKSHTAVAGSPLKAGDKVMLVQEGSAPYPSSKRTLVAYADKPDSTAYHGTARADAVVGQEVVIDERVLRQVLPPVDVTKDFTPIFLDSEGHRENLVLMLLRVEYCDNCARPTMRTTYNSPEADNLQIRQQQQRAGIVERDKDQSFGERCLCKGCVSAGAGSFTCAFCKGLRRSDQVHETQHGEMICTVCYTTLTASGYDGKMRELDRRHRWDYS